MRHFHNSLTLSVMHDSQQEHTDSHQEHTRLVAKLRSSTTTRPEVDSHSNLTQLPTNVVSIQMTPAYEDKRGQGMAQDQLSEPSGLQSSASLDQKGALARDQRSRAWIGFSQLSQSHHNSQLRTMQKACFWHSAFCQQTTFFAES